MKEQERMYDLIIIGGGPAGLTAGMQTSRLGLKTAVLNAGTLGGRAAEASMYENFPGFSEGRIFQQEQIARAVELGVGIQSAKDIQFTPIEAESEKFIQKIERSLEAEWEG